MGTESTHLGQSHIRDNDNVDGAGGILGGVAGVTAGVVRVLALAALALPRHSGLGDLDVGLVRCLSWCAAC